MQDTLKRINKIQDEWNKPLECKGPELTEEEYKRIKLDIEKKERIQEIKAELTELSKDFIQAVIGYSVPDLANRKVRFNELYTELCALEGKEPRSKESNIKNI